MDLDFLVTSLIVVASPGTGVLVTVAAYLLYMAWMTLREHGPLAVETDRTPRSVRETIVSAILVNLLNPKLSIFFFAFLPQFVPAESGGAVGRMLELSVVFMAMTFAVFVVYPAAT